MHVKRYMNGDLIKDKIIILVDDSIVRGNTLESLSKLFFSYKCKELHIRICSPELKYPVIMVLIYLHIMN